MTNNYRPQFLTEDQINQFLEHGYIHLTGCFTRETAQRWTADMWTRLGYDPSDRSTWLTERINMPNHRSESIKSFAPTAWPAICDLLGGEDRITPESATWEDGLIVNLGGDSQGWIEPRDLRGWHVDGDSFVHFLNSPEQGLLVIPLFSDIQPHGGGTILCLDAIKVIARHLYDHPEGVSPYLTPKGESPFVSPEGLSFFNSIPQDCTTFVEARGEVGDVYLLHPLMLHTASINSLGIPRVITNPRVAINKPFNFHRTDGSAYSVVERTTIKALGRNESDGVPEWVMRGQPEKMVPERESIQRRMKELEVRRLKGEKVESERESGLGKDEEKVIMAAA